MTREEIEKKAKAAAERAKTAATRLRAFDQKNEKRKLHFMTEIVRSTVLAKMSLAELEAIAAAVKKQPGGLNDCFMQIKRGITAAAGIKSSADAVISAAKKEATAGITSTVVDAMPAA